MQFFRETKIDFLGKRKIALIFSLTLIGISLVSLIIRGGPNYGIDFRGGTSIQTKFANTISIGEVRSAVSQLGYVNAEIKQIGYASDNEIIIRIEEMGGNVDLGQVLEQGLTDAFPENTHEIRKVDEVGPKIGGELRRAAVLAVLVALLLILAYISWRFEFKFAIGAVAALFHDVIITLGVFSVINYEISLAVVAAFLTIVGYSLNDTIVVFDRIRENLKILRREVYEKILNISINQTIGRTILTSMTTLIVVLTLFLFGGEIIKPFAFALIVGVLIGTYSSIFIASPLVLEWQLNAEKKKGRKSLLKK